jgi:predicted RNase H-like HicB family nuclease
MSSSRPKPKTLKFLVTLQEDEDGFIVAGVPALPGCLSQGRSREEALANIQEAIQAFLFSLRKHNEPLPAIEVASVEVVLQ